VTVLMESAEGRGSASLYGKGVVGFGGGGVVVIVVPWRKESGHRGSDALPHQDL